MRPDHTDRLSQGVGEERTLHRQRIADDLVRPPRIVAQRVDRHPDLDLRLEQRFAVLGRLEPGNLVQPGFEQIGCLGEQAAALPRRQVTPTSRFKTCLRRSHGVVYIRGVSSGDFRKHLFRRWIDHGKPLPGRRRAPLVINEEIGLHFPLNSAIRFS
jgi:hypothetical protein